MGYITNVTILNDEFEWVLKNPKKFVKAIQSGMNSGTDDPVVITYEHKRAAERGDQYVNEHPHETDDERAARVHYVTVHKAQHADDTQLILTQHNGAYPIHRLPWAIGQGWLRTKSNPETYIRIYRGLVNKLRWYADQLEAELDAVEAEEAKS